MRILTAAALALALSAGAADNADPGASTMASLVMGSWKQAEREGHKDFCFTGLTVGMNVYHKARMAANTKEEEEMSGYYNSVTTHFKAPSLPPFSVTVYEPNGRGPNDPTFPLYNYMSHIDGDEAVGHRECIAAFEVNYARAVGIAAKMGLIVSTGNEQALELRRASGPEEPGWSDKKLRGRTYWLVVESVKGRVNQYYIDALTGKPIRAPVSRPAAAK